MPESKTAVGTTYENLLAAIEGETGAAAKYEAYVEVADHEGFKDLARLFACTADAEKIHIESEYALAKGIDPSTEKPAPSAVETHGTDINLIFGANGEIYETSDMYPSFIKVRKPRTIPKPSRSSAVQNWQKRIMRSTTLMPTIPSTPRPVNLTISAPYADTSIKEIISVPALSA